MLSTGFGTCKYLITIRYDDGGGGGGDGEFCPLRL